MNSLTPSAPPLSSDDNTRERCPGLRDPEYRPLHLCPPAGVLHEADVKAALRGDQSLPTFFPSLEVSWS